MKKTNRMIAGVLAAVMGLASLPILSASAAEAAYVQGDVDLDGVITGHDSAVVSRSLYVEGASLTEEQAKIADMDGDGVVDQTDLETIHAKEVYVIGDFNMVGNGYIPTTLEDAFDTLVFCSVRSAGTPITILPASSEEAENLQPIQKILLNPDESVAISQVRYNLMDVNGDGEITENDVLRLMYANSRYILVNTFYGDIHGENGTYHL